MKIKKVFKAISTIGSFTTGLASIGAFGVGIAIAISDRKHNQQKRKTDPYEHY